MINKLKISPETLKQISKVVNTSLYDTDILWQDYFLNQNNWYQRGVFIQIFHDKDSNDHQFDGQIKKSQSYFITFPLELDKIARTELTPQQLKTNQGFYFDGQFNQGRLENANGEIILFRTDELGQIRQAQVLMKRQEPSSLPFSNQLIVLSGTQLPAYPVVKTDRKLNEKDFILLVETQFALDEIFLPSNAPNLERYDSSEKNDLSAPVAKKSNSFVERAGGIENSTIPAQMELMEENIEDDGDEFEENSPEDEAAPQIPAEDQRDILVILEERVDNIDRKNHLLSLALKEQQDYLLTAAQKLVTFLQEDESALSYLSFNGELTELLNNWRQTFYPTLEEIKSIELAFIVDLNWSTYRDTYPLISEMITSFDKVLAGLFAVKDSYIALIKDFREGSIATGIEAKDLNSQQLTALRKTFQQIEVGHAEFKKSLGEFGQTTKILLKINRTYPYLEHYKAEKNPQKVETALPEELFPEHLKNVAAKARVIINSNNYLLQQMKTLQQDLVRSEKIIIGKINYKQFARDEMNLTALTIESEIKFFEEKNLTRWERCQKELSAFYENYQNAGEDRSIIGEQVKKSWKELQSAYLTTLKKTDDFLSSLEQGTIKKAIFMNPLAFMPALVKITKQTKQLKKELENSQNELATVLTEFQKRVAAPLF